MAVCFRAVSCGRVCFRAVSCGCMFQGCELWLCVFQGCELWLCFRAVSCGWVFQGCELWLCKTPTPTPLGRCLDSDGLTVYNDPVQQRLAQIEANYRSQIQHLQRHLHLAKNLLYHYTSGRNGAGNHLAETSSLVVSGQPGHRLTVDSSLATLA